ncbi:restriction endonuclease subunit S [Candidatus Poribacteria bacterium]|nr:restriction endonuclease subunit S [Candidatus Poribacteria bacterium]
MSETGVGLSELPNGWAWTTAKEIAEFIRGVSYKKSESSKTPKEDFVPILRANNINSQLDYADLVYVPQERIKDEQFIKAFDIVIAMSSGSKNLVGKAAQSYQDYHGGFGTFCGLVRVSPQLNRELIGLFFQSPDYRNKISRLSSGMNINNLRGEHIESMSVPIPSLSEQHRIVAKIEELFTKLDAGIKELHKAHSQLKRYRQSVLKAAFEGKLTEAWRTKHQDEIEPASALLERILKERREKWETEQLEQMQAKGEMPKDDKWKTKYNEPITPDTSDLPELPNGWVWTTLPQIGELNRGKSKNRPRNAPFLYGGRYPFVQTGDIKQANGLIRHYNLTYSEEGLKQSRLWPAGTLCITIAANIADTAILGFNACFPDSMVGFLPERGQCNIYFVEFFLRTAKEDLERYAPATAQKNINLAILKDLAIPFPSLAEQNIIAQEIDRYLSVADEVEKTITAELKRAEQLRQSILKKAFSGKLVPQDPNDEPASVLLERIKAEKQIALW